MSNASSGADAQLADRILASSAAIVTRSLEYMPHDVFWDLRYAERSRRFANEDGAFHVRYLADAVRAGSPTIMAEYAQWLRDLLVPRGMCTLHLIEHLDQVGRAAAEFPGADGYIRAGIGALRYSAPDAARLQDAADELERAHPGPPPPNGAARNSAFETRYLCHYVADALHRNEPQLLERHVAWSRDTFAAQGGAIEVFNAWLGAVDQALAAPQEYRACRASAT